MSAQAEVGYPNVVSRPSTDCWIRTSFPDVGLSSTTIVMVTRRFPYAGSEVSRANAGTVGLSERLTTWSATTRHADTEFSGSSRQSVVQVRRSRSCPEVIRHCSHRNPGRVLALL